MKFIPSKLFQYPGKDKKYARISSKIADIRARKKTKEGLVFIIRLPYFSCKELRDPEGADRHRM